MARVMLANVLHPTHEYEEALQQYDLALPAVRAAQGNSVLVRAALFGQAHCLAKLRNLEGAAATYQDAAKLYREVRCTARQSVVSQVQARTVHSCGVNALSSSPCGSRFADRIIG